MLIVGLLMIITNVLSALTATSYDAGWNWYTAIIGLGFVLIATADLLVGKGLEWMVVVLRAVALLGFLVFIAKLVVAAIGGSDSAIWGLVVGSAAIAIVFAIRKARELGRGS